MATQDPTPLIHVVIDAGLRVEVREARPADTLQALGARRRVQVTVRGELPGRFIPSKNKKESTR